MSFNDTMQRISAFNDSELLLVLKFGLAKYAALFKVLNEHKELLKRKRNARCISVTLLIKPSRDLVETPSSAALRYPNNKSSLEVSLLIESVFKNVYARYKNTSWVRENNEPELNIVILKQFWLDCYICDANFMDLLLSSFPQKIWIGISGFTKSIESTRRTSAFTIFSLKHFDKRLQKLFQMQKMLFFFCFTQTQYGEFLNRENLAKVFCLANTQEKTQSYIWADQFITGISKLSTVDKSMISFEEFYYLIRSRIF